VTIMQACSSTAVASDAAVAIVSSAAGDDERWDAYVATRPDAHRYHISAWRRIIESSFGHRGYYLRAEDSNGSIRGVLPLVRLRSRMFGDFLVSLPFVNYGGACADNDATTRALVDAAVGLAARLGVRHLELRTEAAVDCGLRVRSAKVSMRLPLPGSAEQLWKALSTKMRTKIRRVQQEDMTVQIGRDDQLDAFYDVFAVNMRDLGTPVYAKNFFRSVLRELPDSSWVATVFLKSEPVAAGFLIGFRDAIEIPWGSSHRRYNHLRPNFLLYWNLLKFAVERGYGTFDFGRSSPDSGPYQFKAQWDATPVPLNWQYWVPRGEELPNINPQNPKYQLAVRVWQHLPVPLTRLIGPSVVRNIP
jgi:serine/alanine adding enzyme